MRPHHLLILLSLLLFALTGCVSYTTLQTAKPLDPGSVNVGLGAAVPIGDDFAAIPEIGGRVGIIRNADVGAKVSLGGLFFIDGKYQIIEEPLRVSADVGWSYTKWSNDNSASYVASTGWYPALLAGGDRWYVGIRGTHLSSSGVIDFFGKRQIRGSGWVSTNVVIGGSFGGKFRILPEVNIYFPVGSSVFAIPGIGFQFNYW